MKEDLLKLDPSVFKAAVTADTHVELPGKIKIYTAEVGAEAPADLSNMDPEVWKPIHEDMELLGGGEGAGSGS